MQLELTPEEARVLTVAVGPISKHKELREKIYVGDMERTTSSRSMESQES